MLAVGRIGNLQTELNQLKTINLALTQDLESARRQAERATEEARLRMDEAHRLASEVEGRVLLLRDLERELRLGGGDRAGAGGGALQHGHGERRLEVADLGVDRRGRQAEPLARRGEGAGLGHGGQGAQLAQGDGVELWHSKNLNQISGL